VAEKLAMVFDFGGAALQRCDHALVFNRGFTAAVK